MCGMAYFLHRHMVTAPNQADPRADNSRVCTAFVDYEAWHTQVQGASWGAPYPRYNAVNVIETSILSRLPVNHAVVLYYVWSHQADQTINSWAEVRSYPVSFPTAREAQSQTACSISVKVQYHPSKSTIPVKVITEFRVHAPLPMAHLFLRIPELALFWSSPQRL